MSLYNIEDYRRRARRRLPRPVFDYIDGGAGDEVTLRANRNQFERYGFAPRSLVDVSQVDLSTTLAGRSLALPLLFSPTGFVGMAHPDGEPVAGLVADERRMLAVISSYATYSIEEVRAIAGPGHWFGIVPWGDRGYWGELVDRAEAAGIAGLVVAIDCAVDANRERDHRNGFTMPPRIVRHAGAYAIRPAWVARTLRTRRATLRNVDPNPPALLDFIRAASASVARLATLKDQALLGYSKPGEVNKAIAAGYMEIDAQAQLMGWGKDAVDLARREYTTAVHSSVAIAMASETNGASRALKYLSENGGAMDTKTRMDIEAKLKPFANEEAALSVVDEIMGQTRGGSASAGDGTIGGAGPTASRARLIDRAKAAGKGSEHVDGLDASFATNLEAMFEDAPPAIRDGLQIGSGFRSVERQQPAGESLRSQPPPAIVLLDDQRQASTKSIDGDLHRRALARRAPDGGPLLRQRIAKRSLIFAELPLHIREQVVRIFRGAQQWLLRQLRVDAAQLQGIQRDAARHGGAVRFRERRFHAHQQRTAFHILTLANANLTDDAGFVGLDDLHGTRRDQTTGRDRHTIQATDHCPTDRAHAKRAYDPQRPSHAERIRRSGGDACRRECQVGRGHRSTFRSHC